MQNMTADDEDILTFNCIFLPTRYYQSDISQLAEQSKNENLTNLKLVADLSKHPAGGYYYIAEPYDVIVLKANKKDAVDVLRHQVTKRLKPLFNISSSTLRLFMLKYDTSIYEVIDTYNSMVPDATKVEGNSNKNNSNDSDESVSTDSKTSQGSMAPDTTEIEGNSNKNNLNDSVNLNTITIQEFLDKLAKLQNANRNVRNRVNRVNPDNQANPLKSREMKPYEKISYYFDKNGRTNDIQIIASDDKYDPYNTGKNFLEVQEY